MRLNRWAWLMVSGGLWSGVGGWLLSLGAKRMGLAIAGAAPVLDPLTLLVGGKSQAVILLIVTSLAVGWLKGWGVLSKTVSRTARKVEALPEPMALQRVYGVGYLFLIGAMMSMGIILKKLHLPWEVHAMIDIAVGMALMTGAGFYFRCGYLSYREWKNR